MKHNKRLLIVILAAVPVLAPAALAQSALRTRPPAADAAADPTETMVTFLEAGAAETSGGPAATQRTAASILRRLVEVGRSYDAAIDAFNECGGVITDGLTSVEAIDARLVLLARLEEAVEAKASIVAELDGGAARRLRKLGASEASIRGFTRGLQENADLPRVRGMVRTDRKIVEAAGKLLRLLKETFEYWSIAENGIDIRFKRAEDAGTYNRCVDAIASAVAEQNRLRRVTDVGGN
jgi:hypothetical protein